MKETVVVTGCAGFIGFHVVKRLMKSNYKVIGVDIINDYYDTGIKYDRLSILNEILENSNFEFYKVDTSNAEDLHKIFVGNDVDYIINLSAQAGVRYSIDNPRTYQKSNLEGFLNILEEARFAKVKNFVYASSSSVYGKNEKSPFSVTDRVDKPVSLYAATKRANELMAHAYSHLYEITCTGLRYFTAYGPWGRPDMALFLFTKAILEDKSIKVFNNGNMMREFTYIDDIVDGTIAALESSERYAIYNIGGGLAVTLMDFITLIEEELGMDAKKEFLGMQPGDVKEAIADISYTKTMLNYEPKISLQQGIRNFINWYRMYYEELPKRTVNSK